MALQSALEDLLGTTLAGVTGIVGKMEYVASLRDPGTGSYAHWGLSRAYGETAAQQALAEAHRQLFLKMLRTPLCALREDVMLSSGALQMTAEEYMERFRGYMPALLPPDLSGGSAQHFNSVLHALSILVSHRSKNPPEATPPV